MNARSGRSGLLLCLALTLATLDCAGTVEPGSHPPTGKVSDRFPNIRLTTQYDQPVRFYDDLVKDKIVIINFMYTTCTGI